MALPPDPPARTLIVANIIGTMPCTEGMQEDFQPGTPRTFSRATTLPAKLPPPR
jgi:hypothetical protein